MATRKKTGGRKVGTPNKVSGELKGMILKALDKSGGIEYLIGLSKTHPPAFASLLGRILPMQVTGAGQNGAHVIEVTIVDPKG